MRILYFMPVLVRLNRLGACEQDRLQNACLLNADADALHVVTLRQASIPSSALHAFFEQHRLQVTELPQPAGVRMAKVGRVRRALRDIALVDGAADMYAWPENLAAVRDQIEQFRPDVLWTHATYTWPIAALAHEMGIPTVVRSVNNEAVHYLTENRSGVLHQVRGFAKAQGERRAAISASVMAAITPDELRFYDHLRPGHARLLPLASLAALFREPRTRADVTAPIHAFYWGATYNVAHNREGLQFVVDNVMRAVRELRLPLVLHVLGSKVPAEIERQYSASDVRFEGYVDDIEVFLSGMDIAIVPSLSGAGMQQKIFEPMCRGFPVITSSRGLAGYDLRDGVHVLTATNASEFAKVVSKLTDPTLYNRIAADGYAQAQRLFTGYQPMALAEEAQRVGAF